MAVSSWTRVLTPVVCIALVLGPLPVLAEQTIRCDSRGFGYRYCRIDTDDRVEMVRQHSLIDCRENRSWGYDRHGVWVDRGCSADFRVGSRHGSGHKAAAVGAALVGLAALAAIANSKQSQAQEEVASWAVGTFRGYDEVEGADVELTILPGGSLNGRAGRNEFTGMLKGSRLEAGRHVFRVQASGNGFIATDERDSRHRVVFQRSGGGY